MAERKTYLEVGGAHSTDSNGNPIYDPEKTLAISGCSYSFDRLVDEKGEPSHDLIGGFVSISYPGIPPEWMHRWLISRSERIHARIVVKNPDTGSINSETLQLDNAACVSFRFSYEREGAGYISSIIVLQAEFAIMGTNILDNRWTERSSY